jgi:hypothetical protein
VTSIESKLEFGRRTADLSLAIIHAIVFLLVVGYAQNYYFHLRKFML